jgi:cardiolipin synthase
MMLTISVTVLVTLLLAAIAMNFATPEKKLERKIEHRYDIADPQFRREMSLMMSPSIVGGNTVHALQNGAEIFPAMLQAIEAAELSITFETYIYWSGEVGRQFSDALGERARAGVPVHVTLDWAGSVKMDNDLLQAMEDAGVQVHRYRPLHWYNLGRMNNRTHRKLLVVDGRVGFTGGVGIADQWQGHATSPEEWRDTHFRIEGPVVAQLQAAFNDNWIKSRGRVLNGERFFPAIADVGKLDAQVFIASPASGSESMHLLYLLAIAASAHRIDIAASYFVPDDLLIEAFLAARQRGVRVRILLPGPHLDSFAVRIASKQVWGELLEAGVEIFVYQPTMLHVKLVVIDEEFVSVGSTNMDIRSLRLNDEASLNVYDRGFAREMLVVFERDLQDAKPYSLAMWRQRPLREKLLEKLLLPIKSQL